MSLEHHTTTNATDHELAKRRIAEELVNHHRGRDNAVASKDLAAMTPVSASTVRDLIPEIRRDHNLPIGSANGYFVIEDVDELDRQVTRQKNQAETAMQTAREMAAAFNRGGLE